MQNTSLNVVVAPLSVQRQHPTLKQLESCYIAHILGLNKGNVTRAAEVLGVTRRTLQRKLSRGLEVDNTLGVNTIEVNLDEHKKAPLTHNPASLIITALTNF
jgi:hypothetical protein